MLDTPWLRIIHVNEGAKLNAQQLASLKSLVDKEEDGRSKKRPHQTLVTLGGNFLGPCPASSVDGGGASLVDQWNHVGVTHACLGLHEVNHLPTNLLSQRLEDLKGTCLNTNAPDLNNQLSCEEMAAYDVIQLNPPSNHQSRGGGGGLRNKRIAVTGFISGDANLHSVGGACANSYTVQSVFESAAAHAEKFQQQRNKFDLILPLTHQSMQDNRMLASHLGGRVVPIILCGGTACISSASQGKNISSDPQLKPLDEIHNGVRLVQPVANIVAVVDIKWKPALASLRRKTTDSSNKLSITVQLVTLIEQIPPHPRELARGLAYQTIFQQSAFAPSQRLFRADRWVKHVKLMRAIGNLPETKNNRQIFTTRHGHERVNVLLSVLATLLRLGWSALPPEELATVMLPASGTTGSTDVAANGWFTWGDFYREIPDPLLFTIVALPGQVLQDAITYSRQRLNRSTGNKQPHNPPQSLDRVTFIHTCSNVQYKKDGDTLTNVIESIQGRPLDPLKEYLVAMPLEWTDPKWYDTPEFFKPLFEWISEQKLMICKETAQSSHLLIAQALCRQLWFQPGCLFDLSVHGSHGGLTQKQAQNLVRAQITRSNGDAAATQVENEVSQLVAEQTFTLVARWSQGSSYHDKNDAEEDAVAPVDVMLVDPVIMDATLLDQNHSQASAVNQYEVLDVILRDCAADFVGVDNQDEAVSQLVHQAWTRLRGEEDNETLNAMIQSRYDSLHETVALRKGPSSLKPRSRAAGRRKKSKESSGGEVELSELNMPLVRRSTHTNNIV